MKRGIFLVAIFAVIGLMVAGAKAQLIDDIYWIPALPVAGNPVTFHAKISNPGPLSPICVKLLTPGGRPMEQTHPGIGIRANPPMDVVFPSAVVYGARGVYQVRIQLLANDCRSELRKPEKPFRVEEITVEERLPKKP